MKVNVPTVVKNETNIEPGMAFHVGRKSIKWVRKTLIAKKIVETNSGVYVVFNNHTWRPITTYNRTWWKA